MEESSTPTPISIPETMVQFVRAQRLEVAGDNIPINYSVVMEQVTYDN